MGLFRNPVLLLALGLLLVQLSDSQRPSHVPFHSPAGVRVSGLRETATHRRPIPSRALPQTTECPPMLTFGSILDVGGGVLEVKDIETEDYLAPHYDSRAFIEAIRKLTYAPFTRNGSPVEAWAQDTVGTTVPRGRELPPEIAPEDRLAFSRAEFTDQFLDSSVPFRVLWFLPSLLGNTSWGRHSHLQR